MIDYPIALLIGALIIIINIIYRLLKKQAKKRIILSSVLILYLTLVSALTIFPIVYDAPFEFAFSDWYNVIPLKTIITSFSNGFTLTALTQNLGNIIMTIPFGILILLLIEKKSKLKLFLLALSLPLAIESAQLLIGIIFNYHYRNPDIDDVILNLVGTYIGYGIFYLCKKLKISNT